MIALLSSWYTTIYDSVSSYFDLPGNHKFGASIGKSLLILWTVLALFFEVIAQQREVTLLYTNDIESVYDPITAYWIDTLDRIGGFPQLASLIREQRAKDELSFLFDAGDIFTGALSAATEGKLPFDIYSSIGYDAMAIGNHEFEYGWEKLLESAQRARFPFLNANIFYEGTDINLARQYAILERDGFRVLVIGVMGVEAFHNTIYRGHRAGLEVRDPIPIVQDLVNRLHDEVDLVVDLTHQNRSAPMQSDKEVDPQVQRGFHEDYALAGAVLGLDVVFGGHSDNGLWEPVRHPLTGTLVGLTFGQGKHLGRLKLRLQENEVAEMIEGELLTVNADTLIPDPEVTRLITMARTNHPDLARVIGTVQNTGYRKYYRESNLGLFIADILKEVSGADIGWMNPGSFRADLDPGPITVEEITNIYPFVDKWEKIEITGAILREMLEYSFSLNYGLAQLSGMTVRYDSGAPEGERLIEAKINGELLQPDRKYALVSSKYLTNGGDNYDMILKGVKLKTSEGRMIDDIIRAIEANGNFALPEVGRQEDVGR